nr:CGNR zinc finger domain-containing protein [Kibdelosporangium phytohabitans]
MVCRFVNTRGILADDPHAREEIGTPEALSAWWQAQGLTELHVTNDDVVEAHVMREGLRALLAEHNEAAGPDDEDAVVAMRTLAAELRLQVDDTTVLRPTDSGTARTGLAWLLAAMTLGRANGSWTRLKVCADSNCREAFRDTTRNRSRTWCSMQVCGARAKQRTFATRHRV